MVINKMTTAPKLEDLLYLNAWPEGTRGFEMDNTLLIQLKFLCDVHGYGRIHQLIGWIYDIWQNPASVEKFKMMREQIHTLLKEEE